MRKYLPWLLIPVIAGASAMASAYLVLLWHADAVVAREQAAISAPAPSPQVTVSSATSSQSATPEASDQYEPLFVLGAQTEPAEITPGEVLRTADGRPVPRDPIVTAYLIGTRSGKILFMAQPFGAAPGP